MKFLTHMESSMQHPLKVTVTQHGDLIWSPALRLPPTIPTCLQLLLCLNCIYKMNLYRKEGAPGSRAISCWWREQEGGRRETEAIEVVSRDCPDRARGRS